MKSISYIRISAVIWAFVFWTITLDAAEPTVEFDIFVQRRAPVDARQQWVRQLEKLQPVHVRIQSTDAAEPSVKKDQLGPSTRYRVKGMIDSKGQLHLPKHQFRLGQTLELLRWKASLFAGKIVQPESSREAAFNMTDQQLVNTFDKLAKPISIATQGQRTGDLVLSIRDRLNIPIQVSKVARMKMAEPILEELKGLSSGTGLAAALRPLGLVFAPKYSQQKLSLLISDVRLVHESWPVGWPREQPVRKLIPKLFDRLEAEIADTPLGDVLDAIANKLEVPFLMDHNSLARQRIDPAEIVIKLPPRTAFYKKILDHILTKHFLQFEVRVDEAGTPFLWISPVKSRPRK